MLLHIAVINNNSQSLSPQRFRFRYHVIVFIYALIIITIDIYGCLMKLLSTSTLLPSGVTRGNYKQTLSTEAIFAILWARLRNVLVDSLGTS